MVEGAGGGGWVGMYLVNRWDFVLMVLGMLIVLIALQTLWALVPNPMP